MKGIGSTACVYYYWCIMQAPLKYSFSALLTMINGIIEAY